MLAKIMSCVAVGVEGFLVQVEVDVGGGIPGFDIVGLPDAAVRESRERVRSSLRNSGAFLPNRHVTVNLAPADIRKEGASFDLPIALGVLAGTGQMAPEALEGSVIIGELSLDGGVSMIRGALSMVLAALKGGFQSVILPAGNAPEACVVEGIRIVPVSSLSEAAAYLNGIVEIPPPPKVDWSTLRHSCESGEDFAEVKGQENARRALEIAAAGGHNALMVGPPGSGKTMLSRRIPSIMPPIGFEAAIELTRIYSAAGMLPPGTPLITRRPFRTPHHTTSYAGLIGGGKVPRPGEVSLAHQGILFLDELPEFDREVLEVLRQPLEDGQVTISRAVMALTYPSRFMLIAAMNPCPCGYHGDSVKNCICTPGQVQRYRAKISGPLLDRIDLHVQVPRVSQADMTGTSPGEASERIRERVLRARERQHQRWSDKGEWYCNAAMGPRELKESCGVDDATRELLLRAVNQFGMSARAYSRTLKLARTIADLAGDEQIRRDHVAEAIQFRMMDRTAW